MVTILQASQLNIWNRTVFCRYIENKNIGEHFQQKNSEIKWTALKYVGYPFGLSFFLKTNIQIVNELKKKTINEYI
jgi:hypothetical protein